MLSTRDPSNEKAGAKRFKIAGGYLTVLNLGKMVRGDDGGFFSIVGRFHFNLTEGGEIEEIYCNYLK